MLCVHCSKPLTFAIGTDRGTGRQAEVYRCHFCGFEVRERRPKREIGRLTVFSDAALAQQQKALPRAFSCFPFCKQRERVRGRD